MILLAILDVQVGDLIVVLLDERHGVVIGRGEVADIEVDAVVLAVGHQGVVAFERGGLVGVVGRIVAMIADHQLVRVGDGRDALGHGEGGAGGDGLHAEALGHAEAVLDIVVFHAVLHVVAEQRDVHADVVEFLSHGLPGGGVGERAIRRVSRSRPAVSACCSGVRLPSATALSAGRRRRSGRRSAGRGRLRRGLPRGRRRASPAGTKS